MIPIPDWLLTYIAFSKDVITAIVVIIGAVVAVLGLKTWRKQLKGNTEYDLVRRVLRAVYKVRDTITTLRHPFIGSGEMIHSMKEAGIEFNMDNPDFHNLSEGAVYQARWRNVQEAYSALEVEALEAEVLWGSQAKEKLAKLRKSVASLSVALDLYLRHLATPGILDAPSLISFRKIITAWGTESDKDKYAEELSQAINDLESFFRPYLKL